MTWFGPPARSHCGDQHDLGNLPEIAQVQRRQYYIDAYLGATHALPSVAFRAPMHGWGARGQVYLVFARWQTGGGVVWDLLPHSANDRPAQTEHIDGFLLDTIGVPGRRQW